MELACKINRQYYITMRSKGYSHDELINSLFEDRIEMFSNDVKDLKILDYKKSIDIEYFVNNLNKPKKLTKKKSK